MVEEVGLKWKVQDMSKVTEFDKYFLALGSAHGFAMYNGLSTIAQIYFEMLEPKRTKQNQLLDDISISYTRNNKLHYIRYTCSLGRRSYISTLLQWRINTQKKIYAKNETGLADYQFSKDT